MRRSPARPHPRAVARDRSGFSIVELLVALIILAVGMLGLVGVSMRVTRQIGTQRSMEVATTLAETRLDSLRGVGLSCATMTGLGRIVNPSPPLGMKEITTIATTNALTATPFKFIAVAESVSYKNARSGADSIKWVTVSTTLPCY